MGYFEVLMLAYAAYSAYAASMADDGKPVSPSKVPPDPGPIQEETEFTNYQNDLRNELLAEYYGGKLTTSSVPYVGVGPEDHLDDLTSIAPAGARMIGTNETTLREHESPFSDLYFGVDERDYETELGDRVKVEFGGRKPSNDWRTAQMDILKDSANTFSGDLSQYYADRGIANAGGTQVAGAQAELGKAYDQTSKEIAAKSHDIYAVTLGKLMGEVSDAGAQTTALTGAIGQANQAENARRDESYANAMADWSYEQAQPGAYDTIAKLLPYLAQKYDKVYTGDTDPEYAADYGW